MASDQKLIIILGMLSLVVCACRHEDREHDPKPGTFRADTSREDSSESLNCDGRLAQLIKSTSWFKRAISQATPREQSLLEVSPDSFQDSSLIVRLSLVAPSGADATWGWFEVDAAHNQLRVTDGVDPGRGAIPYDTVLFKLVVRRCIDWRSHVLR